MKSIMNIILILLLTNYLYSQDPIRCLTHEPGNIPMTNLIEHTIQATNSICIPVVVHIVYNTSAQNISESQILSQINVMNEDFRKMIGTPGYNTQQIGSDTKYEFRLADIDPSGIPTNGITRHYSNQIIFNNTEQDKETLRNFSYWNPSEYFNIWVVPELSFGALGFTAKFPWETGNTDGIVIANGCFGDNVGTAQYSYPNQYNTGRTTTHETGHYLGLLHTFQGGCLNSNCSIQGDLICDTSPVSYPNYSCAFSTNSCHTDNPDLNDLIEDYMDYTYDYCMNIFTNGQTERMDYNFSTFRSGLANSNSLSSNDFIIFGEHFGYYEYNSTTKIISKSYTPYSVLNINAGSFVSIRSKQEIILTPGFNALNGSNFQAFIDYNLPSFSKIPASLSYDNVINNRSFNLSIHPNPFNSEANISISVQEEGNLSLKVMDMLGNSIFTFADNEFFTNGIYNFTINSASITSGLYFVLLQTPIDVITQKVMVMK